MEKEELLELIKGMREDDRKRLADSSIPAAGEERFVPVRNGRARILYYPAKAGSAGFYQCTWRRFCGRGSGRR